jgi:ATP-dependent RNA helicase RhlE
MKDLIERHELHLRTMSVLVLDEADRMLDMGFLPDIRRIISEMPTERQTLFFSATMTPEIQALTSSFLDKPYTVSVRTSETSDHVEQDIVEYEDKDHKYYLLEEMLGKQEYDKVLVFGETKFGVQRLADRLNKTTISAAAIHGNKSQSQRQRARDAFKAGKVNVLVATDVAARGLDIPNVSHVINFDTPQAYEDYVHRIGRTGRAGARGHAHTFVPKPRTRA